MAKVIAHFIFRNTLLQPKLSNSFADKFCVHALAPFANRIAQEGLLLFNLKMLKHLD